eukprot:TRINITY_DN281_c2_g5_i1.p1 TRINITY_DN281_c2_g5~~TRINITY_DN281_c2_g5_i1.p1  ORF type:complete len:205 (+),score=48.04 TRINITY_DN281_c2_g5_i1:40-615(+)
MGCFGSTEVMTEDQYDHLFKLVLVGRVNVGKSSLVLRYCDNTFLEESVGTIGSDFKVQFVQIGKVRAKLQIWDTAGQEKFRQMTSSYFGGANAVIIVFDVSNQDSFNDISVWVEESKRYADENTGPLQFIFVGNKTDLPRVVDKATCKETADQYEALYVETSAKNNDKVSDAFYMIAEHLTDRAEGTNARI